MTGRKRGYIGKYPASRPSRAHPNVDPERFDRDALRDIRGDHRRPLFVRYICKKCGKQYKIQNAFQEHVKRCDGTPPPTTRPMKFKCPSAECGAEFKTQMKYGAHLDSCQYLKPDKCHLCGAIFTFEKRTDFKKHVEQCEYAEKIRYKCHYCGLLFPRNTPRPEFLSHLHSCAETQKTI